MANTYTGTFEHPNFYTEITSAVGSPLSAREYRQNGHRSIRFNATGSEISFQTFATLGAGTDLFHSAYCRFISYPSSAVKIIQLRDGGGDHTSIRMTTAGKLQLWNDRTSTAQVGVDSSVLNLNQWYRIGLCAGTTHVGNDVQAQINGVEFASEATHPDGADHRAFEIGVMGSVTHEFYTDDIYTDNAAFPAATPTIEQDGINYTVGIKPRPFSPGNAR